MRVDLLDAPAYSPPYDDALATALARRGAEVRLLSSAFAYGEVPEPRGYVREEIFYRRAVGPAGSRLRTLTKRLQHVPDLLRYRARAGLPDVVHLQWAVLLDLALAPHRPLVVTVHDPHGIRGDLDRADAVIVHTGYAREVLAERVAPERLHVVPHGPLAPTVPPGALPPELGGRPDRPVVLCFGLIRPYKGVEVLLEAWREVSGAELWIVGRPMYELDVPGGIGWVPRYVSPAEQAALFAAADIVVLPYLQSERFGFSGVLAAALAAGTPAVVSTLGGFAEVIEAGAAAPVPPGDPGALARTLQALIDDPAARRRLGAAASQAAENRFSWDRAAQSTLAIYDSISSS